jgi:hypothetical protein
MAILSPSLYSPHVFQGASFGCVVWSVVNHIKLSEIFEYLKASFNRMNQAFHIHWSARSAEGLIKRAGHYDDQTRYARGGKAV